MATLFLKQAKQYSESRPIYPQELFQFIASKSPNHDLVWDVGTGNGQAARSLAGIYKNVIATDTSQKQLDLAPNLSNVRYQFTSPNMSISELQQIVGKESSIDLITIAQAMHFFDLPMFYQQVRYLLKKPDGVIAAWCYERAYVNKRIDSVLQTFYTHCDPYMTSARKLVADKYMNIDFPFEPVENCNNNGPFKFEAEKMMDLESFFTYLRSWSSYQTAKGKGVELLRDDILEDFNHAWNEDGQTQKIVTFPIYLRIGKVGISDN